MDNSNDCGDSGGVGAAASVSYKSPTTRVPKKSILKHKAFSCDYNNEAGSASAGGSVKENTGSCHTANINKQKSFNYSTITSQEPEQEQLQHAESLKRMHWDEMNILATYHPEDKDYGFMKVNEPPTPYNRAHTASMSEEDDADGVDAKKLNDVLNLNQQELPKYMKNFQITDDDNDETSEEMAKRNPSFEAHRKAHYDEFLMAKLLREKIQDDEDENEDENEKNEDKNQDDDAMV